MPFIDRSICDDLLNSTGVFAMTPSTRSAFGTIQNNIPQPYDFNVDVLFNEAWKRVRGAKATYWGAVLISILINVAAMSIVAGIIAIITYIINGSLDLQDPETKHYLSMGSNLVTFLLYPLLIGIYYLGIRWTSDQPIQTNMIFEPFKRFFHILGTFLLTYICTMLVIFVGIFIFGLLKELADAHELNFLLYFATVIGIITFFAALYVYFGFLFAPVLVFEKKMGILAAIKASFLGFSQHWFKIFILYIAMTLLIIVSAIPVFIGYIWTIPMGINLFGILYRTIFGVEK
jgi:hypothetical protein